MAIEREIQRLNPSSVIQLFELSNYGDDSTPSGYGYSPPDNVFRFTNVGDVSWRGQFYQALPCECSGFEFSGKGTLPRPRISISNVGGTIGQLLFLYGDLVGATLTRRRTLRRFLTAQTVNHPSLEFRPDMYIIARKVKENKQLIEFELLSALDQENVFLPKRQILASACTWLYRGSECGYVGPPVARADDSPAYSDAEDVCGKRLSSCKLRFGSDAALPFGSFPGVIRN